MFCHGEWTVAYFDNRLCYLRENIDIGVKNAEFAWTYIYAAEIIAGSVPYPGKYELHTGMRGVIANDTVWYSRFIMWLHEWHV